MAWGMAGWWEMSPKHGESPTAPKVTTRATHTFSMSNSRQLLRNYQLRSTRSGAVCPYVHRTRECPLLHPTSLNHSIQAAMLRMYIHPPGRMAIHCTADGPRLHPRGGTNQRNSMSSAPSLHAFLPSLCRPHLLPIPLSFLSLPFFPTCSAIGSFFVPPPLSPDRSTSPSSFRPVPTTLC